VFPYWQQPLAEIRLETREQANAFAAFKNSELRKYGAAGSEFSSRLREEAAECAERLSWHGKPRSRM
jgi:hypothetical protein